MIAFRHFTKTFASHPAVRDLSLEIGGAEVVALLGPNGSGKTTTLKAAAGLIRPTSGDVLIGEPGRPAGDPGAREALSFLPQRVAFPESLTGREVIEFYRRLRGVDRDAADAALKLASLNGSSGRAIATYSGGMVQRLGLAVALLPSAPVMLLDEPTAALDPDGLCAFYSVIEHRKAAGQTILFTSHQLGDAERLADRFAILVDGRLAALLTARELSDRLASRGVLRLRVEHEPADLLNRVRRLSPEATQSGDQLIVPGPAGTRPAVVDLVRESGASILGLTAEEGRLDVFYRDLVGGRS
ncbi:MAG: ABC transporter ATP-binding protein [Acidobacteria bacterium]|nr:ABC transporter ATP-binding protein [Acidobacteriota bacterium]